MSNFRLNRNLGAAITNSLLAISLSLFGIAVAQAQTDPGIRTGNCPGNVPCSGGPIANISPGELAFWQAGATAQFTQVEAPSPDGLGPRFNLDSCSGCHVAPTVGGSSPLTGNPQVTRLHIMAPGNVDPPFITLDGPIREVRFKNNPDGTADGGVHSIFTIAGRVPNCNIAQPDFSNTANLSFRVPTPVFGTGLIESITDSAIRANLASELSRKQAAGITGHVNTNGNDGTVTRFGWKAQNKSLLLFAGEAYNVEMGVTNELFQTEREEAANCNPVGSPNSHTDFTTTIPGPADIVSFMAFMKFLAPPTPNPGPTTITPSSSVSNGRSLFSSIGCSLCHTFSLRTGSSTSAAFNNVTANLFSDLAVHHMGSGLADGVSQGNAGPDEFRTAPLWGVGQRAFFLHDGRTSDLLSAILMHDSPGSEADIVTDTFINTLSVGQKQDVLNFLRSL